MKKSTIEAIYSVIFILSAALNIAYIYRYITSVNIELFSYILSLVIMILSFLGYHAVRKYLKVN